MSIDSGIHNPSDLPPLGLRGGKGELLPSIDSFLSLSSLFQQSAKDEVAAIFRRKEGIRFDNEGNNESAY